MNITTVVRLIYFLIAVVYLVADHLGGQVLASFTKPLLMLTLLYYFHQSTLGYSKAISVLMIMGLLFSFLGDSFLLFDGELFFVLGLLSFLITHLFYSHTFIIIASSSFQNLIKARKIASLIFAGLVLLIMNFLWPDLGQMRWPVLLYGLVISGMGLCAFNIKDNTAFPIVFQLIFYGALLFIFSDFMIAVDKFKSSQLNLPFPRLLIMVPYIIAQFMIVEGVILWTQKKLS